MSKKDEWQERAARLFCIAIALLFGYLVIRFLSSVLIVFGLSLAVAAVVYPLSVHTAHRTHLPQRLCAVLYVLLLLGLLGGLLVWAVWHLGEEAMEMLARWESGEDSIAGAMGRMLDSFLARLSRLPMIGSLIEMLSSEHAAGETLSALLRALLTRLGAVCSEAIGQMLRTTPRMLIRIIVTLLGIIYLSADYGRLGACVRTVLSPPMRERLDRLRTGTGKAVRRYLRAYLILFLLTFFESLVGLWILRQPYALLIALGVAAVDLLPVLGAGAVLVPWSLVLLWLGDYHTGLGLLILYGVMIIVRQIAEPHLVGKSLGLPPVVTLFAVFVGWELFGVLGMLIAPAAALIVKELFWRECADSS